MSKKSTAATAETTENTENTALATTTSSNLLDLANFGSSILDNFIDPDDILGDFPPFVRLNGQTGEFVVSNDIEFPQDGLMLNIHSIRHGVSLWPKEKGVAPIDKRVRYLTQNSTPFDPETMETPIKGAQWRPFFDMVLKDVHTGQEFTFTVGNASGINAVKQLFKKLFSGAHDYNTSVPVLTITTTSFVNKQEGNRIYKPVFNVSEWAEMPDGMKFECPVGSSDD